MPIFGCDEKFGSIFSLDLICTGHGEAHLPGLRIRPQLPPLQKCALRESGTARSEVQWDLRPCQENRSGEIAQLTSLCPPNFEFDIKEYPLSTLESEDLNDREAAEMIFFIPRMIGNTTDYIRAVLHPPTK